MDVCLFSPLHLWPLSSEACASVVSREPTTSQPPGKPVFLSALPWGHILCGETGPPPNPRPLLSGKDRVHAWPPCDSVTPPIGRMGTSTEHRAPAVGTPRGRDERSVWHLTLATREIRVMPHTRAGSSQPRVSLECKG